MAKTPSPSSRRAARETALRILYMMEVGKTPRDIAQQETVEANKLDEEAAEFSCLLVDGTLSHQDDADIAIAQHATHYPLDRQTIVDRNILRIAATEILFDLSGAPYGVVANEAVELAKKYSTPEAAKFINGVIGGLIRAQESISESEISLTESDTGLVAPLPME
ncbi:MAG: transcription antitermination factor NusB [Armatimonadetes bacterium]|nr:transcription antitermination factor NusB [Armatimonadota bacterium]